MAIIMEAITQEEAEAGLNALEFVWAATGEATEAEENLAKQFKRVIEKEKGEK